MCRCFWLFSFLIVLCGCDKIDLEKIRDLRIIAHRGGTTQYPENSLAAIANAINLGVDAIEIDIRLCKDSTIVVCHDDNIDRVTNGSGKIKDMTYEEILAFSLKFEGTLTDQVIPTLDDVLQLVDMKVELYIEIKDGSNTIDLVLFKLLDKYDCFNAVSIISFDYHTLVRISEKNEKVRLKYLLYNVDDPSALPRLSNNLMDGMILDNQMMNKDIVDKIKAINKTIEVYTVDDISSMSENQYDWIEGLISNRPEYWMSIKRK